MRRSLILFGLMALTLNGCNKNNQNPASSSNSNSNSPDTTPPVITLNGSTNDTVSLNSSYSDPGAMASDNVNGNISSSITVSGAINSNLTGEYRLYYNVKDAAGNAAAQMTRYVYVRNDSHKLEGAYSWDGFCPATPTSWSGTGTSTISVSATKNNVMLIPIVSSLPPANPAEVTLNGSSLAMPYQNLGTATIQGNGWLSGKMITLNYTVNYPSLTTNCSRTYTKN